MARPWHDHDDGDGDRDDKKEREEADDQESRAIIGTTLIAP